MTRYITVDVVNAGGTKTRQKIRVMGNGSGDPCCMDCGTDTDAINESYMVADRLWRVAVPEEAGMLCVGCLEKRLGRKLQRKDFTKLCVSAAAKGMPLSKRLRARLRRERDTDAT